jgi:acyl phosphate:glycerol-3-phosphate acyltransferase
MITAFPFLIVAIVAYLLGSIPFGFLLVLAFRKEDIRTKGSGNIGATNVVRSGAKGLGALTFLLDGAKGYVPVWLASRLVFWPSPSHAILLGLSAIAAIFTVLGHMYPVWLRFKGGKGVATAFGVFLALSPQAALGGLAIFVVVLVIWRYVSLASIVSAVAFPIVAVLLARDHSTPLLTAVTVLIPVLVIVKHRQNIHRLLDGTEHRFGRSTPGNAA